jgi:hypothetical protein
VSVRLAGPARVVIAAVSIVFGTAACGSDEPGAERSDPVTVLDASAPSSAPSGVESSTTEAVVTSTTLAGVNVATATPTTTPTRTAPSTASETPTTTTTTVSESGVSEADVIELEQQLDEIDRVLADIEAQLAQD